MAHHVAAVARAKPHALVVGDLPWMSYHVSVGRHGAQRGRARPGRGAGREARGRPQARPDGRGARRRRDPGDGPHRADAAVGARHGWLQGAGPRRRGRAWRWSTTPRRWRTPAASPIVLEGVPDAVASLVTASVDGPDHRHRRGPATATARCSWCTTCSASRTASRRSSSAATPTLEAERHARRRGVRRRRALGPLPDGRRELSARSTMWPRCWGSTPAPRSRLEPRDEGAIEARLWRCPAGCSQSP